MSAQMTFAFTMADQHEALAREFAVAGNYTMTNHHLHKWAMTVGEPYAGRTINAFINQLRKACPYPSVAESIGDPELFE